MRSPILPAVAFCAGLVLAGVLARCLYLGASPSEVGLVLEVRFLALAAVALVSAAGAAVGLVANLRGSVKVGVASGCAFMLAGFGLTSLAALGLGMSSRGGLQPPPSSTLVSSPPEPSNVSIEIHDPVYFLNGSAELSHGELSRLGDLFIALTDCPGTTIKVSGYASSAEFKNDPKGYRNLSLARDRGDGIVALAKKKGLVNVTSAHWASMEEMVNARGFMDVSPIGKRLAIRELLNRRSDLAIRIGGGCAKLLSDNARR